MTSFYKIPVQPKPQRFTVTLGGVRYRMTLAYRKVDQGGWFLDIADAQSVPLVRGIPLVTGTNLLGQHMHLGFNGRLYVQTASDPDAVPTFDNLGIESFIFWVQ